jgi:phosphate transport system substrate-binding protein
MSPSYKRLLIDIQGVANESEASNSPCLCFIHGRNPVNGRMDNVHWRRALVRLLLSIFIGLFSSVVPFLSSGQGMELLGAGATFPYPLYSKMFYVYWQATGVKTNYQAIGSGGGQRQLLNMTVDFGGSDAFMTDETLEKAPAKILHIPICLGAVAITYNLPGNPELKFTPNLLSEIFLGNITRWNDKRILNVNAHLGLSDRDIVLVHRSEGSGTTFVFTDYLSKVSNDWEKKVGRGKAVNWPVSLGSKGNPGVAGLIKYFPGAIGYVELGYALSNQMPVALLQNKAGEFIRPSTASASVAANVSIPEDTRISITNTDAEEGYPISSFTWILVFKEQAYRGRPYEKAKALKNVLWWMTHEGQRYAKTLHYAPLPERAVKKAEKLISTITYDGKPIIR